MLQYAILADIEGGLSEFLVFGFIHGRYVDADACVCTAVPTLLVNVHSRFSSFELVRVIRPRTPRLQRYYEGCGRHAELGGSFSCTYVLEVHLFPRRADFFIFLFCLCHFSALPFLFGLPTVGRFPLVVCV